MHFKKEKSEVKLSELHLLPSCVAQIDSLIDGVTLSMAEQATARLQPAQSDTRKVRVPSSVDVAHGYNRAPITLTRYVTLPSNPY